MMQNGKEKIMRRISALLVIVTVLCCFQSQANEAAKGPLMTRWAADLTAESLASPSAGLVEVPKQFGVRRGSNALDRAPLRIGSRKVILMASAIEFTSVRPKA
jgi:hypothetical protein